MSLFHTSIVAAVAVGGLVALPASAAVIINATVETRVDDRHTNGDYDELGNNAYPGQYLAVGDSSGAPATGIGELRTVIEFDISSHLLDITAPGATVEFSIPFSKKNGSPQNFQLWALSADEDGVVTADDYEAAGTFIGEFSPASYTTLGQLVTIDVTSAVKADALNEQTWSAFRFQVADPTTAPNGTGGNGNGGLNGTNDSVEFVTPSASVAGSFATLTVVPEPAAMALLGLAGLSLTARRRRV